MLHSQELLLKFSDIIGIPETEARSGFQILLKQLSEKLSYGDEIEIESLGYFAYKKVRTNLSSNNDFIPVMIFSTNQFSNTKTEHLIFFLPDKHMEEFPSVDSFLNLSFGKPIIIPEKFSDELPLLLSTNEIIGLIESKVERLIASGKIYKCTDDAKQEFDIYYESTEGKVQEATEEVNSSVIDEHSGVDMGLEKNIDLTDDVEKVEDIKDYELVEPEGTMSASPITEDSETKEQIFSDDFEFKSESGEPIENAEIKNGYAEISDNLLRSTISELEHTGSGLEKADVQTSNSRLRKRKLRRLVFSILALIILASISIGVYLNYEKIKEIVNTYLGKNSEVVEAKPEVSPKIINRSYEIPISYPYEKNFVMFSSIQDSLLISPAILSTEHTEIRSDFTSNQSDLNLEADNLIEVSRNIFQKGSEFIIQVSSWKSYSKAQEEVKKYIEHGYNAELLEASSDSIGKYFRVMVRDFNSLNEARNFLNRNK
jgi:hypothetical protein